MVGLSPELFSNESMEKCLEFVECLEKEATRMEYHGWGQEAVNLRKWASELRERMTHVTFASGN